MNVLQTYRSLDTEQKRILREKEVDLNRPVDEVLALLRPLAGCDTVADKARTPLGCTMALGIALMIAVPIIVAQSDLSWAAAAVPIVLIVALTIGAGLLFAWTKRVDLSNNFREFVIPVLAVFREDIDHEHPVHLRLDLRSPTSPQKKTSESAPFAEGVYYKVIDSTFVDRWMTAEAMLVDGTKLSWSITDFIRERKKTKKNPRGKHKTKTKYKKKTEIEVEVALRKKTYELTAPAEAEVKSGEKRNSVRMMRRMSTPSLDPIVPQALIDVVAGVYQNARRVKKEA